VSLQLKAKLAAQTPVVDEAESVDIDDDIQQLASTSGPAAVPEEPERPVVLDVRPKRSSSRTTAEEERLLSTMDERGRQSIQLQEQMLKMMKPAARPSERATYGEWAKTVMEDLDPSLWRQFQQEQSQLLYKYLDLNDRVRPRADQQWQQQQWQPDQQQQLGSSQRPQPNQQQWPPDQQQPGSSQQPSQWQPPPQNWPTTVQPTSVWDSMNATWVQAQMQNEPSLTTLQPRSTPQSTPQHRATSAAEPTVTSAQDADVSTLSGIFSDSFYETIRGPDTSK
jgi:hypothetical protein